MQKEIEFDYFKFKPLIKLRYCLEAAFIGSAT